MIHFKESEVQEEVSEEEYDYTNEEPLKEKNDFEYEEDETDYCD